MIWFVVAMVAVCAGFSGIYIFTGDIWSATLAGGVPALLYGVGLAVRAACTTRRRACRVAVLLVAVLALSGISAQFMILSSRSRWQTGLLVRITEATDRSEIMTALFDHASPAFVAYQQQGQRKKCSVAEIFKRSWGGRDWTQDAVYLDGPSERARVYASPTPDGGIVLTGVAMVTKGTDPAFVNVNGTSGYLQSRVCISPKGMSYEIEN